MTYGRSSCQVMLPIRVGLDPMGKFLVAIFKDDPEFEVIEPQVFGDGVNGKGMRVLHYRKNGKVDVYWQLGIRVDRSTFVVGAWPYWTLETGEPAPGQGGHHTCCPHVSYVADYLPLTWCCRTRPGANDVRGGAYRQTMTEGLTVPSMGLHADGVGNINICGLQDGSIFVDTSFRIAEILVRYCIFSFYRSDPDWRVKFFSIFCQNRSMQEYRENRIILNFFQLFLWQTNLDRARI